MLWFLFKQIEPWPSTDVDPKHFGQSVAATSIDATTIQDIDPTLQPIIREEKGK